MAVTPLTRASAEQFLRPMKTGRNGAILLQARREDDQVVEVVVKPSARLPTAPLEYLLEWIASAVGVELGVYVPAPVSVSISEEFAAAVDSAEVRHVLRRSSGLAFGSTFVPGTLPVSSVGKLGKRLVGDAASILAFDVFVHNVDRRVGNPNVLALGDRLVAIDHEMAFAFLFAIGAPDPVDDHCESIIRGHALRPHIVKRAPGLASFRTRLAGLSDEFFAELVSATPPEWTTGPADSKLSALVDVLRRRRDAAVGWIPKVEAWMAK